MNTSFLEKRNTPRVDLENVMHYKVLGDIDQGGATFKYESAKTRNISKGGICMLVPHKIPEGNVIRVELPIGSEETFIKAFCEVQWCKPSGSSYEAGLSFIALKEEDTHLLESFVNNSEERVV